MKKSGEIALLSMVSKVSRIILTLVIMLLFYMTSFISQTHQVAILYMHAFILYWFNKYSLKMYFILVIILGIKNRKMNYNPVFAYKGDVSIHGRLIEITLKYLVICK